MEKKCYTYFLFSFNVDALRGHAINKSLQVIKYIFDFQID